MFQVENLVNNYTVWKKFRIFLLYKDFEFCKNLM